MEFEMVRNKSGATSCVPEFVVSKRVV